MFFNAYKKSIKRKVFNSLSTIFEKAYSENMHRFIMKMKIVESILDSKSLRLNKKQVKEILDNFSFIESHLSNSFEELLIRKAKELLSIINTVIVPSIIPIIIAPDLTSATPLHITPLSIKNCDTSAE